MSGTAKPTDGPEAIPLKDPALAAFLAWLIPGLGHLYQGRYAKAGLFSVCILGTFLYGLYLGGSSELGWGRAVYVSWRAGDKRLHYLCQVGVGLPALPALVQANRMARNKTVWWNGFMAPPRLPASGGPRFQRPDEANLDQPTPHDLHRQLPRFFELGSAYTMIAGLLNILAIYDAWGGPVVGESPKKKEDEEEHRDDEADAGDDKPPA